MFDNDCFTMLLCEGISAYRRLAYCSYADKCEGKVNKEKRGKGNLYIAFAIAVLAVPLVSALRGRIPADTTDYLYGILIGLAIVFLGAGARNFTKPTSRNPS